MKLSGKKVAILVADGFEEVELTEPRRVLNEEGAQTFIVSPSDSTVRSWAEKDWGAEIKVDLPVREARPEEFDALVLPGGVMNPDKLRTSTEALNFISHFVSEGKPIAAICHGPWTLIEVGGVKGRRVTSYKSLKTDLQNAGASWEDAEVVVDSGLVTSRTPTDLPAFTRKMVEEIGEGIHQRG